MVDLVKFLRDTLGLELNKKFYIYKEVWKKRYTAMFTTSGIKVEDCPYSNDAVLSEILFNPECSIELEPLEDGAEQAISEVEAFIDLNDNVKGARENKSALSYIRDFFGYQESAYENKLTETRQSYEARLADTETAYNDVIASKDATISSLESDLAVAKATLSNIIWEPNKTYNLDDVCLYGGKFYVADGTFTSSANFTDGLHWQLVKYIPSSGS